MAKSKNLFCLTIIVCIWILFFCGCDESKPAKKNPRPYITYYSSEFTYAGRVVYLPTKSFAKEGLTPYTYVFWCIDGLRYETGISLFVHHVVWSKKIGKLILVTSKGVCTISVDGKTKDWIWKTESLLGINVFNEDMTKLLVRGLDIIDSPEYFIAALDIVTGHVSVFKLNDSHRFSGMVFTENDVGSISVGEDLIVAEFAEKGDHSFSVKPQASKQGEIVAKYMNQLVFYTEGEDYSTLLFGDAKTMFDKHIGLPVITTSSYMWVLTKDWQVYRVDFKGTKLHVASLDSKRIGHGLLADGLWIATHDGKVKIFSPQLQTTKIELPSLLHK